MTTATIDIGTLITHSPEIRAGKPTIAGTGITVHRIVSWYKLGLTPEEILARIGHPHLDLAKIYAGLSYYHANREKIETDLLTELAESEKFAQEWRKNNQQ